MAGDFLKQGFLLGLGAAVSGKEKVDKRLEEMIEKNEITREQARKLLDNLIDKGEMKTDEWSEKQVEQTQQMGKDLGLATEEDINALKTRVAELENRLNQQ